MAGAATEHFVDGKGLPFQYSGEQYFTEVPYSSGFRTDIAVTRINPWDAARRRMYIGHLTPLPDERKYRRSYRTISRRGPFTRRQWIKEDATYSSEQTSREVWDWMDEHGYLAPVSAEGAGGGQARLPIDIDLHPKQRRSQQVTHPQSQFTIQIPSQLRHLSSSPATGDKHSAKRSGPSAMLIIGLSSLTALSPKKHTKMPEKSSATLELVSFPLLGTAQISYTLQNK
jgi:hypothetical protein